MTEEITTRARWDLPKQTIIGFGDGKEKVVGDCMRCCIAAVLNLPASEVPHFVQISTDTKQSFNGLAQEWLGQRGFTLAQLECGSLFNGGSPFFVFSSQNYKPRPVPMICGGPTMRSKDATQTHAVVMENGQMVYDPHPSEAGLLAVTTRYLIIPHLP